MRTETNPSAMPEPVDDTIAAAARLESEGRVRDAIDLLTRANRDRREQRYETELVRQRHYGYRQGSDEPIARPPRRAVALQFEGDIAAVAPEELDADVLEAAISRHGCLLVRGLIPPAFVEQLVEGIEATFAAYDDWKAATDAGEPPPRSPWFSPFEAAPQYEQQSSLGRAFTRATGGIYTSDSPRMLFEVIEMFERLGLGTLLTDYMAERPALSAAKCNLRRTPVHIPGGWHQDGSFIGADTFTVDVWSALSACGLDAPGLDIVPRRLDHLLPTGLDGVVVPAEEVDAELAATPGPGIASPQFEPGDTLLFDHYFLHRTAISEQMTRERYALETWFFAPSRYPPKQVPILY
jgi:hypothetical protein